jgi:hypothetical protein
MKNLWWKALEGLEKVVGPIAAVIAVLAAILLVFLAVAGGLAIDSGWDLSDYNR